MKMEVRDGEANTPDIRKLEVPSKSSHLALPSFHLHHHYTLPTPFLPLFPHSLLSIRFSPLHDTHCLLRMSLTNASHSTCTRAPSTIHSRAFSIPSLLGRSRECTRVCDHVLSDQGIMSMRKKERRDVSV